MAVRAHTPLSLLLKQSTEYLEASANATLRKVPPGVGLGG